MAFLVSDVTARVRLHMSSFPQDVDANALIIMKDVHSSIVEQIDLYPVQTVDISLTSGTREYSLDPDIFQIKSGVYLTSASSYVPLWETSIDWLDYNAKSWRMQGTGQPTKYYELGGNIGFYPTPNTTTSGGYPIARLTVKKRNAITSISDSLPSQIPNLDAYVYGACLRYAQMNQADSIQKFQQLYALALEDLRRFIDGKLLRQKPSVRANTRRVRNF